MPGRGNARPPDLAPVAQPVATYGITPEALTFYVDGRPAMVIGRDGWDGLMVAKMEGRGMD